MSSPGSVTTPPERAGWMQWAAVALVIAAFVGGGAVYISNSRVVDTEPILATVGEASVALSPAVLEFPGEAPRDLTPYRGYGTWVDVFDYDPAYGSAIVGAADLAEMAELGVKTLYLQAARLDDRTPGGLVDPWLLTKVVLAAEARDIAVVGWYLPKFGDGPEDLERLVAMADFGVLGRRLDGLAVDIEWIGDGIDDETRTRRLLDLSTNLHERVGEDPVGAIVPPPVQIEVINDQFWPGFPWEQLAATYDVWLPMSYWSFRSDASGYGEGYTYHEESVRRLRRNVGDPEALIHGIGGIGGLDGVDDPAETDEPLATVEEIERFAAALADTGSIGGSIYDWNTLEPAVRERLAQLVATS